MQTILNILKSLSDETRLRIVNLLYEGELCVCDIMAVLQIPQTKASRHLIYLKNAGLVTDRKQAQWVHYSLRDDRRLPFLDSLVRDQLRTLPECRNDLETLRDWLKQKKSPCS